MFTQTQHYEQIIVKVILLCGEIWLALYYGGEEKELIIFLNPMDATRPQ